MVVLFCRVRIPEFVSLRALDHAVLFVYSDCLYINSLEGIVKPAMSKACVSIRLWQCGNVEEWRCDWRWTALTQSGHGLKLAPRQRSRIDQLS